MKTLVFVGCNSSDDVVRLARQHHRSYLFEPLPEAATELRAKVAGIAGAEVCCVACGEFESTAVLNVYNTFGLSSSLGTMSGQALERWPGSDLSLTRQVQVNVCNLLDFLTTRNVGEIETLVIDAQGMDLAILKTIEPLLESRSIKTIRTEADGEGFRHYDGLPDNSAAAQREYMSQFDYTERRHSRTVSFHPDLIWERNCETTFDERLERIQCRTYV